MKNLKYILHSVAVLAVATLATACSSEDELTDNTSGTKATVTLTAYQPSTRVRFDKDGNGYWQAGDKIGVWSNGDSEFEYFDITSGAGEASATFSHDYSATKVEVGKYAVYPYDSSHKMNGDTLIFYLPHRYSYSKVDQTLFPADKDGNSFKMPMYGTITNNEVAFKHLGGVICLVIDKMVSDSGNYTYVDVISSNNQLYGDFKACLTDSTPDIKTSPSSSKRCVKFSGAKVTEGQRGVFYLPVATGNYDLTIRVYNGQYANEPKCSTTKVNVDVKRGELKVVNVKTDYTDKSKEINGHYFVDLLLPSGLLWAARNIGAKTNTEYGDYFAWGETTTKDLYDWPTYKYGTSEAEDSITKYNSIDGKTVLDYSDDAAYVNWGAPCRMPTKEDWEELMKYTDVSWKSMTDSSTGETINGILVKRFENGNSIFFPAAGFRGRSSDGTNYGGQNSVIYYYSSTRFSTKNCNAHFLFSAKKNDGISMDAFLTREYGFPVRAVAEP